MIPASILRQRVHLKMRNIDPFYKGLVVLKKSQQDYDAQDPCLEKYYPTSPYVYCAGNPIRYIDPTGCDIVFQYNPNLSLAENRALALQILEQLQKLTDDKLSLEYKDQQFRVQIINKPINEGSILLLKPPKPLGTFLIRALVTHKQILTLDINNSQKITDIETGSPITSPTTLSSKTENPQDVTILLFPNKKYQLMYIIPF